MSGCKFCGGKISSSDFVNNYQILPMKYVFICSYFALTNIVITFLEHIKIFHNLNIFDQDKLKSTWISL
jgi:hypothetical protein